MSYYVLPVSIIPVSHTTVQLIMYLETYTDAKKSRFKVFYDAIQERFHEKCDETTSAGKSSRKPTREMWAELAENEE